MKYLLVVRRRGSQNMHKHMTVEIIWAVCLRMQWFHPFSLLHDMKPLSQDAMNHALVSDPGMEGWCSHIDWLTIPFQSIHFLTHLFLKSSLSPPKDLPQPTQLRGSVALLTRNGHLRSFAQCNFLLRPWEAYALPSSSHNTFFLLWRAPALAGQLLHYK